MDEQPIGLDISPDTWNPRALCADCMDGREGEGALIYKGDEWGAWESLHCSDCGVEIPVTIVHPLP